MSRKTTLILTSIAILGFSGCTSSSDLLSPSTTSTYVPPTERKNALYSNDMRSVASGIQHDINYNKIELDTPEKKAWFKKLTYRLWDRQITNSQFMSEGLAKYPTHRYEFDFIIKGFASL
ncbi:MAG: hypothetical protein GQ531_00390 [Sulfurovum sp.]|nr:hypothetical protein [Sulfurovum sp.]